MKIAFLEFLNWDYKVESVYQMALGGSQSALCYLAEALAQQGQEVFLLNNTAEPGMSRSVMCLPLSTVSEELLHSFDALIALNSARGGIHLREILGTGTRLILWTQHAATELDVKELHLQSERDVYDGFAFVSDWQRDRFYSNFDIDPNRSAVLRNAIGPSFCHLFPDNAAIFPQKSQPPVLAYTSTPFRGLDLLLEVFPKIRAAVPGTKLKVFSSMKVYQFSDTEDESRYGQLYRLCRETEGVEYIGAIPQPELARELRSVMVLAYPNIFAETSCIAVMEAMASGCRVVTSNLGALPETTAGFADLIPISDNWEEYKNRFVEVTIRVLKECTATDRAAAERHLQRQVSYVNCEYIWSLRAQQWVEWLNSIELKKSAILLTSLDNLQQQGYQCIIWGEYSQAATFYERAIDAYPTVISNYWYLGLTLLLQGKELEAQTTWAIAMMSAEREQIDAAAAELAQVLQAEIRRQEALANYQMADLIRQCL